MSAPAGLWTICDLKVEGSAGCAAAILAETASAIASRAVAMVLERRPIHFSLRCVEFLSI